MMSGENKKKKIPTTPAKKPNPRDNPSYWLGVADTENSKTFLAGRIVTWLPRQIRNFFLFWKENGIQATLKKVWCKLKALPENLFASIKSLA